MGLSPKRSERDIKRNIAVHDRIVRKYEQIHDEIFNETEQTRIGGSLKLAREAIRSDSRPLRALDLGSGSGNLTRHLVDSGFEVTAADVSSGFLQLIRSRYPTVTTLEMNGRDLSNIPDGSFDLVGTYSVLHHIPDYLGAVREMARVCKVGGVIFIDHEPTDEYWVPNSTYNEFRSRALRFDWRKYVRPRNYFHYLWRLFDPRHTNEGDIHVWPDDHVEWVKIGAVLGELGFEIVHQDDYLLCRGLYRREIYDQYAERCSDTKMMIFRKCAA